MPPRKHQESSLIVINSKDRINLTDQTSNFSVNIGSDVHIQSFAVKSVSLTNIQYNVNSHNNTITTLIDGVTRTHTVPIGQYTTNTLMAALKVAIDTDFGAAIVDFTQSPLTQKITATFDLESQIIVPANRGLSLAQLIGFNSTTVTSLELVAPGVPKLQGTYNYYIQASPNIGCQCTLSSSAPRTMLTEVPNDVSFGNQIIYEPNDFSYGKQRFATEQPINQISISVLDDNMRNVDLQGTDVVIVLKLFSLATNES